VKEAKVPALHLYGLRHSSAPLKIETGMDVRTVSEGLGHKDVGSLASIHHSGSAEYERQHDTAND
jgi:site-specific recombinase XerD